MREQNPNANIVTTPWDQLQAQTILQAMEHSHDLVQELMEQAHICPVCGCEEHEEEHDHDHTKSDGDHDHCHCHDHEHPISIIMNTITMTTVMITTIIMRMIFLIISA